MATLPTIIDLFGDSASILSAYKTLFPEDLITDPQITSYMTTAFNKIEPFFGEVRNYDVLENTVRNEHIKRAVTFEANSISIANGGATSLEGGLNTNENSNQIVKSESMDGVSTTYADEKVNTSGLGDNGLMRTLGLLSMDGSILLSRYIRKTYGMGASYKTGDNINVF